MSNTRIYRFVYDVDKRPLVLCTVTAYEDGSYYIEEREAGRYSAKNGGYHANDAVAALVVLNEIYSRAGSRSADYPNVLELPVYSSDADVDSEVLPIAVFVSWPSVWNMTTYLSDEPYAVLAYSRRGRVGVRTLPNGQLEMRIDPAIDIDADDPQLTKSLADSPMRCVDELDRPLHYLVLCDPDVLPLLLELPIQALRTERPFVFNPEIDPGHLNAWRAACVYVEHNDVEVGAKTVSIIGLFLLGVVEKLNERLLQAEADRRYLRRMLVNAYQQRLEDLKKSGVEVSVLQRVAEDISTQNSLLIAEDRDSRELRDCFRNIFEEAMHTLKEELPPDGADKIIRALEEFDFQDEFFGTHTPMDPVPRDLWLSSQPFGKDAVAVQQAAPSRDAVEDAIRILKRELDLEEDEDLIVGYTSDPAGLLDETASPPGMESRIAQTVQRFKEAVGLGPHQHVVFWTDPTFDPERADFAPPQDVTYIFPVSRISTADTDD